jgi:hypothetical protein
VGFTPVLLPWANNGLFIAVNTHFVYFNVEKRPITSFDCLAAKVLAAMTNFLKLFCVLITLLLAPP